MLIYILMLSNAHYLCANSKLLFILKKFLQKNIILYEYAYCGHIFANISTRDKYAHRSQGGGQGGFSKNFA